MTDHQHGAIGRRQQIIVYRSPCIVEHRPSAFRFDHHRSLMTDPHQRRTDQRYWITAHRWPLVIDHHHNRSSTNTWWIVREARTCINPTRLASGRHHARRGARRQARLGALRHSPTHQCLYGILTPTTVVRGSTPTACRRTTPHLHTRVSSCWTESHDQLASVVCADDKDGGYVLFN